MKRSLFAAFIACVLLGFSSCEYYSTYPTEVIYESNFLTLDLRVNASNWAFSEEGGYYFCTLDVPELSSDVYNYGVISCYREYNKGTDKAYQLALPQTLHNIDASGALWTTTIDYSFSVGLVEIVVTNSDYYYPNNEAPEGMDFRLNLVW